MKTTTLKLTQGELWNLYNALEQLIGTDTEDEAPDLYALHKRVSKACQRIAKG
jgi:hypothetical protein